jgi:hypothetical protein
MKVYYSELGNHVKGLKLTVKFEVTEILIICFNY